MNPVAGVAESQAGSSSLPSMSRPSDARLAKAVGIAVPVVSAEATRE
jgi:hypothetical protein